MPKKTENSPQSRILEAAENAFAEFGFNGASLRHIVEQAGVNLATVYYYFQSKEGLQEAVLKRRFGPLRDQQLGRLRQFEQAAGNEAPPVEKILEAMLLPPLQLLAVEPAKRQAVTRLIGRIVTEPNPQTQEALRCQGQDVRAAFLKALAAALPAMPQPELRWRLEFVWGAVAFLLCNSRRIAQETRGACDPSNTPQILAAMMQFFSPGFRAPAIGKPPKSGSRSRKARSPSSPIVL